jgi:hypothetical protein
MGGVTESDRQQPRPLALDSREGERERANGLVMGIKEQKKEANVRLSLSISECVRL